ncbi:hypothetical protein LMG26857_00952 [Achromobacter anxifer]|uniref:hypothetical protein n=1 Tax=Achromobacter anxifer TaxID=1287737 RepID=UPI00155C39A0|nr:hypothetical protein [Achromobacter anxifer]CAB5511664.1 hypothetical protein LMG26857_00952 [Achromobacter anxifer]
MNPYISVAILLVGVFAAIAYRRAQRDAPGQAGRRLGGDLVSGGALYGVAAPPIGGAGVILALTAITRDPETLLMLVYALPWFYIFGFVPALLCGIVAGALRPAQPSWLACAGMALIGAVYGFVFLLGFGSSNRPWQESFGFCLSIGAAPGAFSAFLCARLLYGKPGRRNKPDDQAPHTA